MFLFCKICVVLTCTEKEVTATAVINSEVGLGQAKEQSNLNFVFLHAKCYIMSMFFCDNDYQWSQISHSDDLKYLGRHRGANYIGLYKTTKTLKNSICSFNRCSVNAAPQQISEASKEVEKFIKGITRSKKERKPVRPHVIEVGNYFICD